MIIRWLSHLFFTGILIICANNSTFANSAHAVNVSLSKNIYTISVDLRSGAPMMPTDAVAAASCTNAPQRMNFIWHVSLDWNFPAYPTHHSINQRSFIQPSPLHLDFGNEVRGGTLKVTAEIVIDGQKLRGTAVAKVIALNPTREQILRSFPTNRFGLIASKIGVWESGMRQFNPVSARVQSGLPYTSITNDVGLMQLNPGCGSLSSPDQIWDWRANVRRGLVILRSKFEASRSYPFELISSQSVSNQPSRTYLPSRHAVRDFRNTTVQSALGLSSIVGTGQMTGDMDVDHIALSEWERDAIRRYNGGREYSCELRLNTHTRQLGAADWKQDATRGGIKPACGDRDYVRHVLRSRSGMVLLLSKPPRMFSY